MVYIYNKTRVWLINTIKRNSNTGVQHNTYTCEQNTQQRLSLINRLMTSETNDIYTAKYKYKIQIITT